MYMNTEKDTDLGKVCKSNTETKYSHIVLEAKLVNGLGNRSCKTKYGRMCLANQY